MNTRERAEAISVALNKTGLLWQADAPSLLKSIEIQLGHPEILDRRIQNGGQLCRAMAMSPLLHILSENTPEAAIQSLARGILLGAEQQWLKTPQSGLPELETFLTALPAELARKIEHSSRLHQHWLDQARGIVAFGSDRTIDQIRSQLRSDQHLQAHGHKLSCAVLFEIPDQRTILKFLQQVALYQQLGCLSPHQVYLAPDLWHQRNEICAKFAETFRQLEQESPRPPIPDSARTRIQHARTQARLAAALEGEQNSLWESAQSTAWTIVLNSEPELRTGPGHRFLYFSPLPENVEALGAELRHCSSVGIFPAELRYAEQLEKWNALRICPITRMQAPSIHWHHDGIAPLTDLVTWQDIDIA